ncbi:MAG TPA: hypothetical protein VGL86_04895, partial [Polyangia bacterium]
MRRFFVVLCALGLSALPAAAAQTLRLDEPTLSAATERCSPPMKARCEGVGQRTIDYGLECDRCTPMPAELTAPSAPPASERRAPDCLPGT